MRHLDFTNTKINTLGDSSCWPALRLEGSCRGEWKECPLAPPIGRGVAWTDDDVDASRLVLLGATGVADRLMAFWRPLTVAEKTREREPRRRFFFFRWRRSEGPAAVLEEEVASSSSEWLKPGRVEAASW